MPSTARTASYTAAWAIASVRDCTIEFGGTALALSATTFQSVTTSARAPPAAQASSAGTIHGSLLTACMTITSPG